MIETVKIQGENLLVNGNMGVPKDTANKDYREVLEWVVNGGVIADEFTAKDIEDKRVLDIEAKADEIIEAKYTPKKQRKLMSISIAIQDKQLQQLLLTPAEEKALIDNRAVNKWITDIRSIENAAITNGTLLDNIDWEL